jgi:hypothetical protein
MVNRIEVSLEVTLPTAVLGCIGPGMPEMLHKQNARVLFKCLLLAMLTMQWSPVEPHVLCWVCNHSLVFG